jgi:nicotinate phosphoribosyltransferase
MASIDLASRVHNHNYRIDPIVRSLLDTDFYKLLMANAIRLQHPNVDVAFVVKNRTKSVRLADCIDEGELRAQLDHVRGLRFTRSELIWLQGNTFYGQTGIFPADYIEALRTLVLPPYTLERDSTGEYVLSFEGDWFAVTLWEIYALAILNELRARSAMRGMSRYDLRVLYANATAKIVADLKTLRAAGVPRIAEFGTRRRHGFLWQEFVVEAMQEELGDAFLGTSNAYHAYRHDLAAIGTNAHELPMVEAALADIRQGTDAAIADAQFQVLRTWQATYKGHLLVALADTFGTTQFLARAPEVFPDIAGWRGFREDSKDPFQGGEEKIAFWKGLGVDPRERLQLFSDGLDVPSMVALHQTFDGRILDGYGWGTNATNNFRGCDPRGGHVLDPISIVCKVAMVRDRATGRTASAVKLSDNFTKATGAPETVARYRSVFGSAGMANIPTEV